MAQRNGQAVLITGAFGSGPEGGDAEVRDGFDLRNFERLPARDVRLDALSTGVSLRQGGTNAGHVQLLIDAAGAAELPPILVQSDGSRVIDGLHRLEAARLRGDHGIKARFLDCTDSEALVIAMKANGTHGLPLSKADRVAGAQRVLDAHPDWSDRAIAGITGLSAKTVASLRTRTGDGAALDGKRIGRDGRRRPVTAGEGRRRAAEYIAAHPDAPLRQVARETDVSLGTVHDVSARLRRGDSPERDGRRTPAAGPGGEARPVQAMRPVPSGPPTPSRPSGPSGPSGRRDGEAVRPVAPGPGAGRPPLRVAASGDTAPPRRRNHIDAPPTWAAVAAKMANDPAIRYTEGGREFIRWMELHAGDPDGGWRALADAVPPHWLGVIAPIADCIGKEWSLFAERLKSKQEMAR